MLIFCFQPQYVPVFWPLCRYLLSLFLGCVHCQVQYNWAVFPQVNGSKCPSACNITYLNILWWFSRCFWQFLMFSQHYRTLPQSMDSLRSLPTPSRKRFLDNFRDIQWCYLDLFICIMKYKGHGWQLVKKLSQMMLYFYNIWYFCLFHRFSQNTFQGVCIHLFSVFSGLGQAFDLKFSGNVPITICHGMNGVVFWKYDLLILNCKKSLF